MSCASLRWLAISSRSSFGRVSRCIAGGAGCGMGDVGMWWFYLVGICRAVGGGVSGIMWNTVCGFHSALCWCIYGGSVSVCLALGFWYWFSKGWVGVPL